MAWDGCERRERVRMTDGERAEWFAALEAEISDADVTARHIDRMPLPALLANINRRFVRG